MNLKSIARLRSYFDNEQQVLYLRSCPLKIRNALLDQTSPYHHTEPWRQMFQFTIIGSMFDQVGFCQNFEYII